MKKYEKPEIEVKKFDIIDIISESGEPIPDGEFPE